LHRAGLVISAKRRKIVEFGLGLQKKDMDCPNVRVFEIVGEHAEADGPADTGTERD